jgi:hypothetical protein
VTSASGVLAKNRLFRYLLPQGRRFVLIIVRKGATGKILRAASGKKAGNDREKRILGIY